ncbi:MAG TPA: GNAT family N-acetyltransferase, partial [Candidatus Limnocylindrales bacterium]
MTDPIRYREIGGADQRAIHDVFLAAVSDIDRRIGSIDAVDDSDPAVRAQSWERWRSLFEHLDASGATGWLAEDASGEVLGYARSVDRDGVRELTEFFVRPGRQGGGMGRELLTRAFPAAGARSRTIIATLERTALSRYLRTGLPAVGLILYVSAAPREVASSGDLEPSPITGADADLAELDRIDGEILGHHRRVDHEWFLGHREGWLYRRGGRVVGHGYVGRRSGPVALLDPADGPAVLGHLESRA